MNPVLILYTQWDSNVLCFFGERKFFRNHSKQYGLFRMVTGHLVRLHSFCISLHSFCISLHGFCFRFHGNVFSQRFFVCRSCFHSIKVTNYFRDNQVFRTLFRCVSAHFTLAANLYRRAALGEIPSIRSTSSSQRIDLKPMP